jgi:hypothetical protein
VLLDLICRREEKEAKPFEVLKGEDDGREKKETHGLIMHRNRSCFLKIGNKKTKQEML